MSTLRYTGNISKYVPLTQTGRVTPVALHWHRVISPVQTVHPANKQTVRTFVMFPMFVPLYRDNPRPLKDEENYHQQFDFRLNPLYQCNPVGINDCVNNSKSSVPYDVRMVINGLASTERNIYKLVANPVINDKTKQQIIDEYKIKTLSPADIASINSYLNQIITETEKEYAQVSKLVNNKDKLVNSVSDSLAGDYAATVVSGTVIAYIEYKYFTMSYMDYGIGWRALLDILHLQYWGWIIPVMFSVGIPILTTRRKELNALYSEYTQKNYMGKYQYKLDMLNKIKSEVFAKPSANGN
jgi:hypothetical protein